MIRIALLLVFSIASFAASFTISPATVARNSSNQVLTLAGSGTSWDGTTVFTLNGVGGTTKVSQNVSSATAATVTITTGTGTGVLTVTETITGSNTATTDIVVAFPDSAVFVSPGGCSTASGIMTCFSGGWYLKFKVTGTTQIRLYTDTTVNNGLVANDMPALKAYAYQVANGVEDTPYTGLQLPANNTAGTQVTAISGLTSGSTYVITIYGLGANQATAGCYTTAICETVIQGIASDAGTTVTAATLRPKRCVFFGDSYLQAGFGGAASGAYSSYVDFSWSWPNFLSAAAQCEFASFGVGSQGYVHSGQGGYPVVGGSWSNYRSGLARTFTGIDFVFVAEGINDHGQSGASITANTTSLIAAMRAGFGSSTRILIIPPINPFPQGGDGSSGSIAADIAAGVTAAADAATFMVNFPSTEFQNVVFPVTGSSATWCSPDHLHLGGTTGSVLDGGCQGLIGYVVAMRLQSIIQSSGLTGGAVLSGSGQLH